MHVATHVIQQEYGDIIHVVHATMWMGQQQVQLFLGLLHLLNLPNPGKVVAGVGGVARPSQGLGI